MWAFLVFLSTESRFLLAPVSTSLCLCLCLSLTMTTQGKAQFSRVPGEKWLSGDRSCSVSTFWVQKEGKSVDKATLCSGVDCYSYREARNLLVCKKAEDASGHLSCQKRIVLFIRGQLLERKDMELNVSISLTSLFHMFQEVISGNLLIQNEKHALL